MISSAHLQWDNLANDRSLWFSYVIIKCHNYLTPLSASLLCEAKRHAPTMALILIVGCIIRKILTTSKNGYVNQLWSRYVNNLAWPSFPNASYTYTSRWFLEPSEQNDMHITCRSSIAEQNVLDREWTDQRTCCFFWYILLWLYMTKMYCHPQLIHIWLPTDKAANVWCSTGWPLRNTDYHSCEKGGHSVIPNWLFFQSFAKFGYRKM